MAASVLTYGLEARGQVQSAGYFPTVGKEVLSALVHLLGLSIISGMLSRKLKWVNRRSSWPRILVILNLVDSWAFIFTTAILVHGLGMELSITVCMMGIFTCIIFYGTSKMFIYLFLAEKVYAVWATGPVKRRMHCKVYLACLALVSCYIGVAVVMILERIARSDDRGTCYIGLRRVSSVLLLSYDVLVNVLLTSLFVWPLLRKKLTPTLRAIAIRNLWASGIALSTSTVNTLILTAMSGTQLAWVCLASCGVDVVINAITLTWVTSDFSRTSYDSEDDPKPFSDTLTGSAAIWTVGTDADPGLTTSPTESTGTTNIPLSCFSGAPVDVANFPYARSLRDSACARMSPSLLPESMLHTYPYPLGDVEEGGVCPDKGKVRDEDGNKHICSPACSLSSLGTPPASLPLPPRWRRRSATSPMSRRDQHAEIMMSGLTVATSPQEDGPTLHALRPSSSETRTSVRPPHCTNNDLPGEDVSR